HARHEARQCAKRNLYGVGGPGIEHGARRLRPGEELTNVENTCEQLPGTGRTLRRRARGPAQSSTAHLSPVLLRVWPRDRKHHQPRAGGPLPRVRRHHAARARRRITRDSRPAAKAEVQRATMPSWLALVVTEPTLVRLPSAWTLRALSWPAPPSWTYRNDPPREAAR